MKKSTTPVSRPRSEGFPLPQEHDMLVSSKDLEEIHQKCFNEIAKKNKKRVRMHQLAFPTLALIELPEEMLINYWGMIY